MSQKLEATLIDMINSLTESLDDSVKFDRGNDAAGTRVRKTLLAVTKDCQTVRGEIIATRNARKEETV
jgi:hypothetical protein